MLFFKVVGYVIPVPIFIFYFSMICDCGPQHVTSEPQMSNFAGFERPDVNQHKVI